MPRRKKYASRGRGREKGASNGGREHIASIGTSFVPFAGTSASYSDGGYSLQSEAFQTQRNQSLWDSDRRLRHAKVKFVSAVESNTLDPTAPERDLAQLTLNESSKETPAAPKALTRDGDAFEVEIPLGRLTLIRANDDGAANVDEDIVGSFTVDVKGDQPVTTAYPPPQIRSVSPTPSNSSDEVIVFAGRDRAGRGLSKLQLIHKSVNDTSVSRIGVVENKIKENHRSLTMKMEGVENSFTSQQSVVDGFSGAQIVNDQEASTQTDYKTPQLVVKVGNIDSGSRRHTGSHRRKTKRDHEQALIDDYVANMNKEDFDLGLSYNQRDLGGTDSDPWQETEASMSDPTRSLLVNTSNPFELHNLDAPVTSDEIFGSVQAILSKRYRRGGQQYLVVWKDHNVNEARWVSVSSLTDAYSMNIIAQFEAEDQITAEPFDAEDDGRDSDSDDDCTSGEDLEDSNDDSDLLQRKVDRMTDEKIAKLLAKQEELGMGSSEVILFNDSSEGDVEGERPTSLGPRLNRSAFPKVPAMSGARSDFPAATALADAYDGFDIMDFERPSLKKKPKGRKGRLAFDLSDSELEESMAIAWSQDRSKKKEKADERQALRIKGLLGKKNNKPDFKAKYKEGMGIHAVKEEIKNFLMGDNTSLALPPMAKADRKVVHELANAFKLKSKSAGNGNKRFPMLYRTSQTTSPSEVEFGAIEARLTRRYLPRMDLRGKNSWSVSKGSDNKVSYRDGDIVGGSAPELGIDNKGRAMLEKMGWSTGTALGALNNKGILLPVPHVVKTTKTGLG